MAKKATPGSRKAPANTLTRGHKKKARTRQQLLDAAPRIYAHAGVGDLALNTLAEEAGVSNGTVDRGAEHLSIAVRTFINKARTDPDWTRVLITVVRYAEGMRSTLASYLRAGLQAGRRQGDFHYAHEEMAMSIVLSATHGCHEPARGRRRGGTR